MRSVFSDAIEGLLPDDSLIFITGDLGFNALEKIEAKLCQRFINAGVAEQNMVGAAAGLTKEGFKPWVYSISPFIYARAFEQIRNDVCFHNLSVRFVGNGGGFGYGVMGPTHHALEDYGVLLTLTTYSSMRVFIPAFREDISYAVKEMHSHQGPAYLRLGRCEKPQDFQVAPFTTWRKVIEGDKGVLVVVGPLAGNYLQTLHNLSKDERPALWVLGTLPYVAEEIPPELIEDVKRKSTVVFVEEHGSHGGTGDMFLHALYNLGLRPKYSYHYAKGYISGTYGSQNFHRAECQLDLNSILLSLNK